MLLETLTDTQTYMKSTLLQCLAESNGQNGKPLPSSYRNIIRREREGVEVYTRVFRDPSTNWRMYTGKQIRDIVTYEYERSVDKTVQ